MKKLQLIAFAVATALLASCGGGGTTTVTPGGPGARVEALQAGLPVDLNNLQVGDSVQIIVANYDSSNVRTTVVPSGVTKDDAGAISTLSGSTLTATATSGTSYNLSVQSSLGSFSVPFKVKPVQARVKGTVIQSGTSLPLRGVTVRFYTSTLVEVASATSQYDGSFNASVPTSTTVFTIDATTLGKGYNKQFGFNTKYYLTGLSCAASLPTLTSGVTTNLATPLTLFPGSAGPPPPPTGCTP